ncbi:DMT family transporter [Desulfosediminicola sp.]|uniref:DMT family transporter n=1 Tax=Desulfosediminicola sp. TaxID=2886825 RepID=UPI003AF2B68A
MSSFLAIPVSVRFMLCSALFFALMGGCVKGASLKGIPVLEILAARALISSALSYIDIRRKRISPWGINKPLLIARGVVGTMALVCVFYAVTTLPLAEATLLQYLYPVFTSLLAFFFLKEKILRSTIVCILLSLTGLLVMVQPGFSLFASSVASVALNPAGVAAAILGSLGTGIAYVLVRKLSSTEDPSVIIFYFPFIALPVSFLLLGNNFVMPPDAATWALLLLVGVFTQIAQYCLTMAIKGEKAAKATAYSYAQVIFSALIGWAFFMEVPTITTLLGALFIIGGALVNLWAPLDRAPKL